MLYMIKIGISITSFPRTVFGSFQESHSQVVDYRDPHFSVSDVRQSDSVRDDPIINPENCIYFQVGDQNRLKHSFKCRT